MFQATLLVVPLAVTTLLSTAVAAFVLRKVLAEGATGVTATRAQLLVWTMIALWTGGQVLAEAATTLPLTVAGIYLTGVASLFAALGWLLFAIAYTGREEWLTWRRVATLSLASLAVTVVVVFNRPPLEVIRSTEMVLAGSRWVMHYDWGPGVWLFVGHDWLLTGIANWYLLEKLLHSRNVYRKLTFLNLTGSFVLMGAPLFSILRWSPFEYFQLSVVAFLGVTLLSLGAVVSLRTLQLLPVERLFAVAAGRWRDIGPMARDAIIQDLQSGVVVLDRDNNIVDLNPMGRRMLAAQDRRVVGRDLREVLPRDTYLTDDTSFLDPETVSGEFRGVWVETPSGDRRCFDIAITAVGEDGGDHRGRTALITDVTERERRKEALEERTRELERQNEQLEEFAGIVSHDLRNPLTVARGYLQTARASGDEDALAEAEASLDRMERIIEDVLALARQGQSIGETEPVDLEDVAREAWNHVETPDAELRVADDCRLEADADRLLNCFENLYRNARDHAGPAVTVTVGTTDDGFFVADDGPGIPEERREEVLESGVTTDETGTGFGLAIVSRIAEAHGWDLAVTESDAGGAGFEFRGADPRPPGTA